jgi:hypothetical protein
MTSFKFNKGFTVFYAGIYLLYNNRLEELQNTLNWDTTDVYSLLKKDKEIRKIYEII